MILNIFSLNKITSCLIKQVHVYSCVCVCGVGLYFPLLEKDILSVALPQILLVIFFSFFHLFSLSQTAI